MTGNAPSWFTSAVATDHRRTTVDVRGCPINVLSWGDTDRPGLVLVHGGAAHAHWWSFLAPQLTHDYHVAALDLSGHGDSGRRPGYDIEVWAEEVLAVAAGLGMHRPIVVGHSMGGFVSIVTAALHGGQLAGTIVVDSPVRRPDPESEEGQRGRAFRNPKTYPSLDEAVEHFHLIPPQPCENDYVVDFIARRSVRQIEGGWTWKFDPAVFQRSEPRGLHEYLAEVRSRIAVLHGQFSAIVTPDVTEHMNELLGRAAPFVEIPQAHHHLLLDQPLAFIAALRALLADWEHSTPRRLPG
ncbi:MAG TPA: alpha/beta hydrolase [Acidimicrobiales bacterium]|nr:alpha/beta hydrolase [Acidimicrobiales bacterium]